jgi:predicted Na+-dependent transporter
MPAFFKLIAGKTMNIDFWHMLFQLLLMVTIPSLVGMFINDAASGKPASFAKSVGGLTSKIALFGVILLNAAAVGPSIHWDTTLLKLLFVIFLMAVCGYTLGYLGCFIYRNPPKNMIKAIIYNVGMRNISFGAVLATVYFSPAIAIPVTLGMLFQQPIAATIAYIWSRQENVEKQNP